MDKYISKSELQDNLLELRRVLENAQTINTAIKHTVFNSKGGNTRLLVEAWAEAEKLNLIAEEYLTRACTLIDYIDV